jgi:hypothetical protein
MSLHNGPSPSAVLKPHSPHCRRLSVDSPQSPQMSYFVPRTFPPPPLVHVPVEYIIDQLHNLAPHYWNRPETTDCTISMFISCLFSLVSVDLTIFTSSCSRTTSSRKVNACPRDTLFSSQNCAICSKPSRSCWFGKTSHRTHNSLYSPDLIKCKSIQTQTPQPTTDNCLVSSSCT